MRGLSPTLFVFKDCPPKRAIVKEILGKPV
jgi:hypothetical protein